MGLVVDKKVLKKPKQSNWVTYIKQRISRNKNFICFISGPTGSGKSYCSLRIAEELDDDFTIDHVVFSGLELMNIINSGKLKKGSVIVFEESGIEMNNRNWQSVTNKMLNFLMQTFRHRNFILIMNSPYMDFIDASTRKLFHAEMITQGINIKEQKCALKPQLIQYNSRKQKFYYKRLRVVMPNRRVMAIDFWDVSKPSKYLLLEYEKKKREYTDRLNKRIYDELLQASYGKQKKNTELTDIQEETINMLRMGMSVDDIAKERNRGRQSIYQSIKLIKKKGYKIEPQYHMGSITHYTVENPSI